MTFQIVMPTPNLHTYGHETHTIPPPWYNTLFIRDNIPGWHNEDEFFANDHQSDYVPAQSSTSTSSSSELDIPAAETTQSMAEIEIADATEGDPLWVLLQELGFNFSETELNEDDDVSKFRDLERDLEEYLPSTESTFEPLNDDYILYSRLRSDCVAHKLKLAIKDGFKTLCVSVKL
ncbi:Uncharacterized protein APZ42_033409 [Daphnia magna]|uniref:Uncharacterized protein n=1 Tax=Daphnia magna TaxID=35525 RepID=A0A164L4I6_9CRUS|nr:Uncharacterized protein APZ42_033409 [Daphnia magna]